MQGQLSVCKRAYCDFVCWTSKGIVMERIYQDNDFFLSILPKLENIFLHYLLPEILVRKLETPKLTSESSTSTQDSDVFCICRKGELLVIIQTVQLSGSTTPALVSLESLKANGTVQTVKVRSSLLGFA